MFVLGRIPQEGDEIVVDGVRLQVDAMAGRRVERVRVTEVVAPDDPEADR